MSICVKRVVVSHDLVLLVRTLPNKLMLVLTKDYVVKKKNVLGDIIGILSDPIASTYRVVNSAGSKQSIAYLSMLEEVISQINPVHKKMNDVHTFCTEGSSFDKDLLSFYTRSCGLSYDNFLNVCVSYDSCVGSFDRFMIDSTIAGSTLRIRDFLLTI